MRLRFFNTYEPVVPLYRDIVPPLAKRGNEVQIVVSRAGYRPRRDLERSLTDQPGVKVLKTINLGLHARMGTRAKAIVMLLYTLHASLRAVLGKKIEQNVFLTQPPLIPFLGWILRKLRGQSYVCILMDLQPQLSVALGLLAPNGLATRVFERLTTASLMGADRIVVIGRCMQERVVQLGVPEDRVTIITNWADERKIRPVDPDANPLRKRYGLENRFVVCYAGNIGIPQYFDDLLQVACEMERRRDLLFVLIGEGVRRDELERRTRELSNVELHPFLHTKHPLSLILGIGDLHFVTLIDSCVGLAVPSKTYGILAAGRPLVYQGDPKGEIARMVKEERIGETVTCGDPERLSEIIQAYADDPERCRSEGRRARALADTNYGRCSGIRRYLQVVGSGE